MTTLSDELRALGALKDILDAANKAAKIADKEFKRHQYDVMERMEAEGCESQRVDGITYSPVRGKVYHTIQDRTAFVAWAKENRPELIELKERGDLCNSLVRERHENGEPLPDGLGFYPREYISQTTS